MMFYVQLGSVMEDFNDQVASFISLARALFGDFDIDDIMNNSSGYLNAILMIVYLFVAVFILLSMFLAILGESQAAARDDQDAEKKAGTAEPEYGVLHTFSVGMGAAVGYVKGALSKKKKADGGPEGEGTELLGEGGGGEGEEAQDGEVQQLKEQLAVSMGDLRDEVKAIAQEVARMAAPPGAADEGGAAADDDARALRKVVQTLEAKMTSRLNLIDEKLARGAAARRKKSSPSKAPPNTGGCTTTSEGDGMGTAPARRRRTTHSAERLEQQGTDALGGDPGLAA